MAATRVTVTTDVGLLADIQATAAERGMSASAWITRCTHTETMRDALTRHKEWCVANGLAGPAYEEEGAQLVAAVAAELDRRA
jgi:hypothetical protein